MVVDGWDFGGEHDSGRRQLEVVYSGRHLGYFLPVMFRQ